MQEQGKKSLVPTALTIQSPFQQLQQVYAPVAVPSPMKLTTIPSCSCASSGPVEE